jgi:general secretion pathway protein C
LLFDQPATSTPAIPSQRAPIQTPAPTRPGRAVSIPPEIARKIARLGPGTFVIERSAVETILEQATKLLRSVRIRPTQAGGKVVGFQLQRVAQGTLLDVLGLKNGDQIQSVNGFQLSGPAQALEAYARLRVAQNIRIKATRDGKPLELEYRIQ